MLAWARHPCPTGNEKGRVDLDYMETLLNRRAEEFLPDLKGLVFQNPETEQWETEDQYLSGDVRAKLTAARAAAPGYRRGRSPGLAQADAIPPG